jgi:hypothetical protein
MRGKLIIKHGHPNLSFKKSSKFEFLGQKKFSLVWDCSQPMPIPPMFPNTKGNGLGFTWYSRKSIP